MVPTFVLLACLQVAHAEDWKAGLKELAEAEITSKRQVGLSIGVIKDGKAEAFGFGRRNLDSEDAPDAATIFEIGSITKVFTTALLADAVKRGTLKLEDPLGPLLPDAGLENCDAKRITLLQLATHTSGLPRQPGNWMARAKDMTDPYALYRAKDLYAALREYEDSGGEHACAYSNFGVSVLGHALAVKAGQPYEKLVLERICDPLKLPDTRVTLDGDQLKRVAGGYTERKPTPPWTFDAIVAAGGLHSTVNDMLRFLRANLDADASPLGPVLAECHALRTHSPIADVGLGWHLSPLKGCGRTMVWHNGGTGGFFSFIGFVKDGGTAVVVLGNSAPYQVDGLAVKILELLNKP